MVSPEPSDQSHLELHLAVTLLRRHEKLNWDTPRMSIPCPSTPVVDRTLSTSVAVFDDVEWKVIERRAPEVVWAGHRVRLSLASRLRCLREKSGCRAVTVESPVVRSGLASSLTRLLRRS